MIQKHLEKIPPFSFQFIELTRSSIQVYKSYFFNYILLTIFSFIPFLLLELFTSAHLLELIELLHGSLLDVLIFLTFPTIYMHRKVFPLATLQIFLNNFFASAVLIAFVQIVTLFFFIILFSLIMPGLMLLGGIPYLFLIFAGFFLILENSQKVFSVRGNLLESMRCVHGFFSKVIWNYLFISIVLWIIPSILMGWYVVKHEQMQPIFSQFNQIMEAASRADNESIQQLSTDEVMIAIQHIVQEPAIYFGKISAHILFSPLKSIFLCFLFIGILKQVAPATIGQYLGVEAEPPKTVEESSGLAENEKNVADKKEDLDSL